MVAFTPIYELPYMEGTDPPCFGPGTGCDNLTSVFCDMMTLVEAQLDENDLIIGRTATAIPMAQVANTTFGPYFDVININNMIFDSVIFDTDNMATLPVGITPRRNGQYRFDFEMTMNLDSADTGIVQEFDIRFGTDTAITIMTASQAVDAQQGILTIQASTLYQFSDTAPVPRVIFVDPDLSLANGTFESAYLTCYWHSDL